MKKIILLSTFLLMSLAVLAQTSKITGRVLDGDTGTPLPGVNILLKGTTKGTATDNEGRYSLEIPNGEVILVFTFVGFETSEQKVNANGAVELADVSLKGGILLNEEIVVSASRRVEKITEAPASIGVISAKDLENLPSFNTGELLNKIQGIEVVRTGVAGIGINARGFNSAFNVRMLQLNDGRNGMLPGGTGLAAGLYNTIIKEDVERIEVIVGPASALYGPNAHAGVINTITKDPRTSRGTTVALGGGNQSVISARIRQADVHGKFAYKANFEYTSGKDFEFIDTVYVSNVARAEYKPDFNFEFIRANAALYYNISDNAEIILDGGYGQGSNIGVTNLGRNQIDGWNFKYLNARFVSPRWFVNVYNTWNDAGNTFQINGRTTNYYNLLAQGRTEAEADQLSLKPVTEGGLGFPGFRDNSQRFNGEVQYNNNFSGWNVILGANYQYDQANSDGTYLYDVDGDIIINQFGGVAQIEKPFAKRFKLVAAARVDKHDYYDVQFSPKVAITANAGGGTFRASFGRAYAAPSIQFMQFLFPFAGGAIIGSGEGLTVQSYSRSVITGVVTLGDTRTIDPLKPESAKTFEVGYKGNLAKKLLVDVTAWTTNSENFLSPGISLFAYNPTTFSFEGEKIIKRGNTDVPASLGDLHITYLNYGEVTTSGFDIGLTYLLNKNFSVGAKYMYFASDITDDDKFEDDPNLQRISPAARASLRSLNAPSNRLSANFSAFNLLDNKLNASLSVRYVPEFDFRSGQQVAAAEGAGTRTAGFLYNYGALGGFTSVDLSAGYKISKVFSAGAGVSNLFDTDQREFVGSPSIGRLYSIELKAHLGR